MRKTGQFPKQMDAMLDSRAAEQGVYKASLILMFVAKYLNEGMYTADNLADLSAKLKPESGDPLRSFHLPRMTAGVVNDCANKHGVTQGDVVRIAVGLGLGMVRL